MQKILNFIDNQFVEPVSKKYLDNINPATGEVFGAIADSEAADVDRAVLAAHRAFASWSQTSHEERAQYLYKIADRIEQRARELAEAESLDQGKPVSLALKMDIQRAVLNFRFFAGAILHQENESSQLDSRTFNYVVKKPVGVAALISPWNLPLYLLTWKIAPAIAAGNTCVCKPSEWTSLTAFMLCEILREVLPSGVVNMIFGTGAKAGEALVKHPLTPLISFTGGTETGKRIQRDSAEFTKKLSLELGGKNPNIVFADSDFEKAVKGSVRAAFLNQGEICLCGSRIYVEDKIYDKFVEAFVKEAKTLKVGDPAHEETFMGPLVAKNHFEKVKSYLEIAKAEGGRILTGGVATDLPAKFKNGFFLNPTVIVGLAENSRCIQEEIFGPVVTISKFSQFDEVVQKANGVKYGLSASVWTKDLDKAHAMAARLQVGTVWINSWLVRDLRMPFGGSKASGVGREGGKHSFDFFTEPTTVCVRYEV